jgi:hypothetical protein
MLQTEGDVAKAKTTNPFIGRWRITRMDEWDQDFVDAEVEGYVEFDPKGSGEFQFGYVHGGMDCRLATRDGPASSGRGRATTRWTRPRAGGGRSSRARNSTG